MRYGRTLGFHEPFFYKLVDVLADTMGDVFPEIRARKKQVQEVIRARKRRLIRRWTGALSSLTKKPSGFRTNIVEFPVPKGGRDC